MEEAVKDVEYCMISNDIYNLLVKNSEKNVKTFLKALNS